MDATRSHGQQIPAGAVVVGIDGTGRDAQPLAFAAEAAARRGAPLHLVHGTALVDPGMAMDGMGAPGLDALSVVEADDGIVEDAVATVRATHPGLVVTASRSWGNGPQALLEADGVASMIVVGSGRKSGVERLFLGSTSLTTAMHAHCPVVVVGPEPLPATPHGRVVVGVDGSRDSRAAVRFAASAAVSRGAELVGLSSWTVQVVDGVVVTEPGSPEWRRVEQAREEAVRRVLSEATADLPPVRTSVRVVRARATDALIEASADADLLVVGSRGRGGVQGMLLGSVSQGVLAGARCPVAVITPRSQGAVDR